MHRFNQKIQWIKKLKSLTLAASLVLLNSQLVYANTYSGHCKEAAKECNHRGPDGWRHYGWFGGENTEYYVTVAMHQGCKAAKKECLNDAMGG